MEDSGGRCARRGSCGRCVLPDADGGVKASVVVDPGRVAAGTCGMLESRRFFQTPLESGSPADFHGVSFLQATSSRRFLPEFHWTPFPILRWGRIVLSLGLRVRRCPLDQELRPPLHQRAPAFEQVRAGIGRFHLIPNHVRQRRFHDRMGRVRAFGRPIAKA